MKIEVKCFATLAGFQPESGTMELPAGATVASAIQALGIEPAQVKITFVNGLSVEPQAELRPGDRMGLFPAVGGG